MRKSIICFITVITICMSLITPSITVSTYASESTSVVTADMEQPLKNADDAVLGEQILLKTLTGELSKNDSWIHEFEVGNTAMIYFDLTTYESLDAEFKIELVNKANGETVLDHSSFINDETDYFNCIAVDAGTYTMKLTNTSKYVMYFDLDLSCSYFYTTDNPLLSFSEDSVTVYTGKTTQLRINTAPEGASFGSVIWESNNTRVATVSNTGEVTAKAEGTATITASVNGQTLKCTVTVKNPAYSINYKSTTLYAMQTKQLKVTVNPSSYGLSKLQWNSSNTRVATVSSSGKVTAKASGTTTITASVNGNKLTCKVTVKPMQMNTKSSTVYVKKTKQLYVYGGTGAVKWKSSNSKVATVTSKGIVKGIKPGTATITATKNGKSFKCKITVKWEPETGITTTKTYTCSYSKDFDVYMKAPGKLSFTVQNTDTYGYGDSMELDVYNPNFKSIISISVAPGKTKTVSINTSQIGKYSVFCYGYGKFTMRKTIQPALSKSSLKVARGYTNTLSVYGVKNGGTWYSSNKAIATVTSKGVIKGKKNGTCYINYKLKTGKILKCKVTVVNPVTCSVTYVSDEYIYNDCGVKFTNNTNKKITYIKLNIKQYNNRGARLHDGPYDWYYVNDNLPAYSSDTWEFWVSDDAKKCKAYITKVYFADGTTWTP